MVVLTKLVELELCTAVTDKLDVEGIIDVIIC